MSHVVLLITPADRHGDALRLAEAGFRTIRTSHQEATVGQMVDSAPAVIALELIPARAADAWVLLAELGRAKHAERTRLLVYGSSVTADQAHAVEAHGATWVPVTEPDRPELAIAVARAMAEVARP